MSGYPRAGMGFRSLSGPIRLPMILAGLVSQMKVLYPPYPSLQATAHQSLFFSFFVQVLGN